METKHVPVWDLEESEYSIRLLWLLDAIGPG